MMEVERATPFRILYFPSDEKFMSTFCICPICEEEPDRLFTPPHGCDPFCCKGCYVRWLETNIDQRVTEIKCPRKQCSRILDNVDDVMALLNTKYKEAHDRNLLYGELLKDPGFMYCPHDKCKAGFLVNKDDSFATCPECKNKVCPDCKNVFHKPYTCEVYKDSIAPRDVNDKKFEDLVKKKCKKCPRCTVAIEKTIGCDHMKCGMCKYEFCWRCLEEYTPGHIRDKHPQTIRPARDTPERAEMERIQRAMMALAQQKRLAQANAIKPVTTMPPVPVVIPTMPAVPVQTVQQSAKRGRPPSRSKSPTKYFKLS